MSNAFLFLLVCDFSLRLFSSVLLFLFSLCCLPLGKFLSHSRQWSLWSSIPSSVVFLHIVLLYLLAPPSSLNSFLYRGFCYFFFALLLLFYKKRCCSPICCSFVCFVLLSYDVMFVIMCFFIAVFVWLRYVNKCANVNALCSPECWALALLAALVSTLPLQPNTAVLQMQMPPAEIGCRYPAWPSEVSGQMPTSQWQAAWVCLHTWALLPVKWNHIVCIKLTATVPPGRNQPRKKKT